MHICTICTAEIHTYRHQHHVRYKLHYMHSTPLSTPYLHAQRYMHSWTICTAYSIYSRLATHQQVPEGWGKGGRLAYLGQLGGYIKHSALAISSQAHALHFLNCGFGRQVLLQKSKHQTRALDLSGRGEHECREVLMSCQEGPGLPSNTRHSSEDGDEEAWNMCSSSKSRATHAVNHAVSQEHCTGH